MGPIVPDGHGLAGERDASGRAESHDGDLRHESLEPCARKPVKMRGDERAGPELLAGVDIAAVFQHLPIPVALMAADAPDFTVLAVNRAFEASAGHPAASIIGQPIAAAFPPATAASRKFDRGRLPSDEQSWVDICRRVALTGETTRFAVRGGHLGGAWFILHAFRVGTTPAGPVALVFYDLTGTQERLLAHTDAELVVRTSEERYRLIVDRTLDYAIFTMDAAGIIDSWAPGAAAVFGWTQEEAIGQPAGMLFTPEDRALGQDKEELALARSTGIALDIRWHLCKDGHRVFVEGTTRAFSDGKGGVLGFLKVGQDVTERRELERALRESENRFRAVANIVPDLLWEASAAGVPSWFNLRWHAYSGIWDHHELQDAWWSLVHPEDRDDSNASFVAALAAGQPLEIEHRLRGADDTYRWFLARAEPVVDSDGRVVRWFGAATDVHAQRLLLDAAESAQAESDTARQEVEQRVRQRSAELFKANASLEASVRALERGGRERDILRRQLELASEEERRRLSRELHDEVGQHLTALGLGLKALADITQPGSEADRRAGRLLELAETLGRELHSLAVRLRPKSLDDHGLDAALTSYVADWSTQTNIAIDTHIALGDTRLSPEVESAVYRIAQEALTNIARHSGAARAGVVVKRLEDSVRVIIEDNGRGFDPVDVDREAPATNRLGLRGMRERAGLLGGSVDVESAPGSGTTLFIRIPLDVIRSSGTWLTPMPVTNA